MEAEPIGERETIEKVRSRIGSEVPESVVLGALSESGFDSDAHVKFLNDNPGFSSRPLTVVRAITSTGARVLATIKPKKSDDLQSFDGVNLKSKAKEEVVDLGFENQNPVKEEMDSDDSQPSRLDDSKVVAEPLKGLNPNNEVKEEVAGFEKQDSMREEMGSEGSQPSPFQTQMEGQEEVSVKEEMGSDGSQPLASQTGMEESTCCLKPSSDVKEEVFEMQDSVREEMGSDDSEPSAFQAGMDGQEEVSLKKEMGYDVSRPLASQTAMEESPCSLKHSATVKEENFEKQDSVRQEVGSDDSQPLAKEVSVKNEMDSDSSQPLASQTCMKESTCCLKPSSDAKQEVNVGFEKQDSVREDMGSDGSQPSAFQTGMEGQKEASVKKEMGSAGSQPLGSQTEMEESTCSLNTSSNVKEEANVGFEKQDSVREEMGSLLEESKGKMSFEEFLKATDTKVLSEDECLKLQVKQEPSTQAEELELKQLLSSGTRVKEEANAGVKKLKSEPLVDKVSVKEEAVTYYLEHKILKLGSFPYWVKKESVEETVLNVDDGDFPEDPNWFLVGRKVVIALSTTKGRKLVDNEIVHFNFPPPTSRSNSQWIVRISTKRSGEVGRLPMEWAKCVIPLVRSSKVKVQGRCVAAPPILEMMQDIMLYVSFYIHRSIFSYSQSDGKSSWRLDACTNIDSTVYPLLTLFRLLEINPYMKAEFTPEELDSRKRLLNLEDDSDEAASVLPMMKRRKGCPQYTEQNKDEQAVSASSLSKLVGAAELYDLEEMEPPSTLKCDLRPYQKQALYWMSELEKGTDVEKAANTLHPCWAAFRVSDERASSIYLNNFTGEATTQFPTATQMARGGILADAMGLGKTVMTIALILARQGKGNSENKDSESANNTATTRKRKKDSHINTSYKANGGTLIVCPMALLGQWKDELENYSEPASISIFVHYGGDRTNDPEVISEHDVVLTTYGVLAAAYKSDGENSIYHRVNWHRVVLDEAHTIKASRTHAAQAAFTLSSHCRWCLTGTPLQNSLEDLFSLLCFLHVEPWCNWAWWNKLIQRPYENGDPRGLKLVKAILRPLMLRRTKDTKDKQGRPILVLPPTDIQVIECEQSEAEYDFYNALFKRSKVQFDQYVAQGKVLHNYANILELLLRLRQCCNHPFLVMSRSDSQQHGDLDKLARRFSECNSDPSSKQTIPSRAYIEEVMDGVRKGENIECPICMESADDPVFTPCAHRMCRECLLSSWRTPTGGPCPLCRQVLKKTDLITCPSENRFRVDVEKNWKESSKVSKLLECLQHIQGSAEKSIVFSQWTSFLDLLEIPLKRKGIGYLRFDGKLAQKQRERVLKEFNETRKKRILLMSLKAGGVGLNLTAASNVFLMDPWWNPAVEEQAIMRIHRIGQKRTVIVRRFIVKDTVEERMQQVQAKKQRMISGALTDEEVRSARLEELKMLFR